MSTLVSLESILDSSADPASAAPAPAPQEVAEPAAPVEDAPVEAAPMGEDAPAAETGEAPADPAAAPPPAAAAPKVPKVPTRQDATPASDDDDLPRDIKGIRAAAKAEREKRKAAESERADTERRFAALEQHYREADGQRRQLAAYLQGAQQFAPAGQQPQQEQRPQRPDPVTDPEGALAYERALYVEALRQQEAKRLEDQQQIRGDMHQQVYATRVLLGQEVMRGKYADYNEIEAYATREAERNPQLREAILNHQNPAAYSYELGKRIKLNEEVQQAGGWDRYYAQRLEADTEARVQARLAALQQQPGRAPAATPTAQIPTARAPTAAPPQSLASVPSATPRRGGAYAGPTPLEDILK